MRRIIHNVPKAVVVGFFAAAMMLSLGVGAAAEVLVLCDFESGEACASTAGYDDGVIDGYPTDTPQQSSDRSMRITIDPAHSAEASRGGATIEDLGSLDLTEYGFVNLYVKYVGPIEVARITLANSGWSAGRGTFITDQLPEEGDWGYLSFDMLSIEGWTGDAWGEIDLTDIDKIDLRLVSNEAVTQFYVDHITFSTDPAEGRLGSR